MNTNQNTTCSKSAHSNERADNDTNPRSKPARINYEKWLAKYRPLKNHFDTNASYDGCLFETYGNEVEFVKGCHLEHVWTLVDCNGKARILEGFHSINRLGYFITEVEAPENRKFAIKAD